MSKPPLAIDLYCGLGGWTEGLLAEGYRVVGFDNERHQYGEAKYPAQLVIQDVLTLHGSQFKDAALIVASPPCQEYSYMAMPWTLAKKKRARILAHASEQKRLTALFDACFRIQREANEAAGRHIPMIVENVRGAQEWVGRAAWHYGSFYLWGDIPALIPIMAIASIKVPGDAGRRTDVGNGMRFTSRDCGLEATKGANGGWFNDNKRKGNGEPTGYLSQSGSKSKARKAASAAIAKIPFVLAQHIARAWKPL